MRQYWEICKDKDTWTKMELQQSENEKNVDI